MNTHDSDKYKITLCSSLKVDIHVVHFEEAMTPEIIEKYNAKTTGGKYILNPNKG